MREAVRRVARAARPQAGASCTPRLAAVACLLAGVLGLGVLPLGAQPAGQSVSSTLTVSVTVVRPCSVSTAAAAAAGQGTVSVSCGRGSSSSRPGSAISVMPISGTTTPSAAVSASSGASGPVLAVNF